MSAFAVVSRIDYLPRLISDVAGLSGMHERRGMAGVHLTGVWVDQWAAGDSTVPLSLPDRLWSGPLRVSTALELAGIWAVCSPARPDVTRAMLLDAVVDAVRLSGASHDGGRFIPVFLETQPLPDRHREWQALAHRHPGIVLPPLEQSRSGVITFTELGDLAPLLD